MCLQALSSPISGVLGNKVDRTHIVSSGCFLWGVMTAAIGMSVSLRQVSAQGSIPALAFAVPAIPSFLCMLLGV